MLKIVTIRSRLILVISLLGLELILGAAVGLISLARANDALSSMYADRLVCLGQLDQVVRKLNLNQLNIAAALTVDPGRVPAMMDEIDRNNAVIEEQWKAYLATTLTGKEKEDADRFSKARSEFVGKALQPAMAFLRKGDVAGATAIAHGPMNELFLPVRAAINDLIQLQLDEAKKEDETSESTYELVRKVCLIGMGIGLLFAGLVGIFLVRSIVNPLERAVQVAGSVAGGDLTQDIRVDSKDETGRLMHALQEMNAGLTGIVGRVRASTDVIATASGQIAAGNLDLSGRTEQQAASLEETAASMEELTTTVKQNEENARQANTLALSASEVADKGGAVVSQVVTTMGAINASALKMADIISVIDGIAFQTNILALNAAVEAARAGEQGRGFAVVASEVRNLAQRSAAAAKEIKVLIDDSVLKVRHGSELVDRAGATMGEIVMSVNRVTDIMAEIMASSEEQTAGIEQVNQAILHMDQATQQNAALVEEASAAAQALSEEANSLANTVGAFRLDTGGRLPKPAAAGTAAARLAIAGHRI